MMEAELLEASSAAGGADLAAKVAGVDGKVDTLIAQVSSMQDSLGQLLMARGAGVPHARAGNDGEVLLDGKGEVAGDKASGSSDSQATTTLRSPPPLGEVAGGLGDKASGSSESQATTTLRSLPPLDPVKTTTTAPYADGVPQRLPRVRTYHGLRGGSPLQGNHPQETRGRGRSSRSREPRHEVKS
jgi:hypothetical protein